MNTEPDPLTLGFLGVFYSAGGDIFREEQHERVKAEGLIWIMKHAVLKNNVKEFIQKLNLHTMAV